MATGGGGGVDEVWVNGKILCVNKFKSYISSVCHLGLLNAVNETASDGQASGFLAKFTLGGCPKIVVVTNNQFVASKEKASRVVATFNFEGRNDVKTIKLDPTIFFQTNQKLDYTFVGIREQDVNDLRQVFDVKPVKLEQTRFMVQVNDDVIHIPHHPNGRSKKLTSSKICRINDSEVFHTADTSSGSSGAPVLYCQNENMYALAVHKDDGVELPDGSRANRGILVSAILDDLCGSRPFEGTREIMRIAQRICGKWEIVARLTDKFKTWEIDNIRLNIHLSTPEVKADKMLSEFKSRLGSRAALAEAILNAGDVDLAEKVRLGYYIDNATD